MAKRNPAPPVPSEPPKRPRGRPPSPNGRKSPAEVQRAYRARLAAAGKVVRLVDAATALPAADPDAPDLAWYQARVSTLNAELRKALDTAEYLKADRERFEARAYEAEARMRDAERLHGLALNEKIVLKQEIAALKAKPKRVKR